MSGFDRKRGIGGSDAGAVLGLNPYRTPLDVWMEKTGRRDPSDLSSVDAVRWGTILEDVIAKEYSRRTGRKVRRATGTRIHRRYDFMIAHVDRLVPGGGILEIKTAGHYARDRWGAPGTDQVPEEYLVQCAHYMAVLDRDWCDLAALIAGQDFRIYRIERNSELERKIIESEREFWGFVERDIPPTPRSLADIANLYPVDEGTAIEATPDVEEDLRDLIRIRREIKELEKAAEKREAAIKEYMGEHAFLVGSAGVRLASWKTQKASRLDIKALRQDHPDLAQKYSKETESRVFRLSRRNHE